MTTITKDRRVTRPLPICLILLLLCVTPASARSLDALRSKAEKGDAAAQMEMGIVYFRGKGVKRDFGQAFGWFTRAADQGNPKGETNLGGMYFHGKGTRQNFAKAREWFRKAADQGEPSGQFNLGVMQSRGVGMAKNDLAAIGWFFKAGVGYLAAGNSDDARKCLAAIRQADGRHPMGDELAALIEKTSSPLPATQK